MTRVLPVDRDHPDPASIAEAACVIRSGGLVAFPTETVYGLGADATNAEAVLRIFEAKGRPSTNPLIVHGHDAGAILPAVSEWPDSAATLARRFWPGPLTLVLPRSGLIPDAVTAGADMVGVRVPDSEVARRLLVRSDRPIAAPSANRSTGVSPTTAAHVLKDLDGRIDLILDAGPTPVGIESTVLDLTCDPPRILRPGAIAADRIGFALGVEVTGSFLTIEEGGATSSPGQMEVHYAPRARVELIDPLSRFPWPLSQRYAVIVAGPERPDAVGSPHEIAHWTDPATASKELYATLHRWDEEDVEFIFVVLPPDVDAWRAVRDRLWRASRRWVREGRE